MTAPILEQRPGPTRAAGAAALAPRLALAVALAATACGEARPPEPPRRLAVEWEAPTPLLVGNQLRNPHFEAGTASWGIEKPGEIPGFELVDAPVHGGGAAARLELRWEPGDRERSVRFVNAAQEISPVRFPDRLAGWYRVERWEDAPDARILQLQVLVGVAGDPRTREVARAHLDGEDDAEVHPKLDNLQIRYQLAGPDADPENGVNFKTVVLGRTPPEIGRWLRFELPVREDFERLWGIVPRDYDRIRVMYGARWDDKPEGIALHADVYLDDLFFGFDPLPEARAAALPRP